MRFLAILVLLASAALTAPTQPANGSVRVTEKYPCGRIPSGLWTSYIIKGCDPAVNKHMLQDAVEHVKACDTTKFEYFEQEQKYCFKAAWRYNIGCVSRLEKKLSGLLGDQIKCPETKPKEKVPMVDVLDQFDPPQR